MKVTAANGISLIVLTSQQIENHNLFSDVHAPKDKVTDFLWSMDYLFMVTSSLFIQSTIQELAKWLAVNGERMATLYALHDGSLVELDNDGNPRLLFGGKYSMG